MGYFSISAYQVRIKHAQFNEDVNMNGNIVFDTVYFNNPGHTVMLDAGDTMTVNNKMLINSSGGFPVSLQSSASGTQAVLYKTSDTVCVDYIYLQNINATGGAVFFAGSYSSNIGNNNGWQFTPCTLPISNVWPGDANYDLTVNNLDILNIGLAYNETGFIRPGASNIYIAQPCLDWDRIFTNLSNIKHADCNGDGTINISDTQAVALNYGQTHPQRPAAGGYSTHNTGPDLFFSPTQSIYPANSLGTVPIHFGTSAVNAQNIYGLAFSIIYDSVMIAPGSMSIDYNGSWIANTNQLVHLEKDFYSSGKIDMGMSRINHANISGEGLIANLSFQTSSNANGPIQLSFAGIKVIGKDENVIPINPINSSITVGKIESTYQNKLSIYPNPGNGKFTLSSNSTINGELTIYDLPGKRIFSKQISNQSQT